MSLLRPGVIKQQTDIIFLKKVWFDMSAEKNCLIVCVFGKKMFVIWYWKKKMFVQRVKNLAPPPPPEYLMVRP